MTSSEQESQGHPAWQSILEKLPEELQALIKPELETWDQNVQQKLQDVHGRYSPYKQFVENEVDPDVLKQSLFIANHLQTNPEDFIRRAVDNYGLTEIFNAANDNDNDEVTPGWEENTGEENMTDPQIAQLLEMVQGLSSKINESDEEKKNAAAVQEFETYLGSLAEEHGEFDRDYVTALISTGIDGAEAVTKYNEIVGKHAATIINANSQTQVPNNENGTPSFTAMGATGTAGSGTPDNPVDMGKMTNNQVSDLVAEMINKANQA